jgi:hypothetical protein
MSGELSNISQHSCRIQPIERFLSLTTECFELRDTFATGKASSSAIAVAPNHGVM